MQRLVDHPRAFAYIAGLIAVSAVIVVRAVGSDGLSRVVTTMVKTAPSTAPPKLLPRMEVSCPSGDLVMGVHNDFQSVWYASAEEALAAYLPEVHPMFSPSQFTRDISTDAAIRFALVDDGQKKGLVDAALEPRAGWTIPGSMACNSLLTGAG